MTSGELWLYVCVVLGLLGVTVWSWLGRTRGSRWWAGNAVTERIVLGVLPSGVSLLAFGVVLAPLQGSAWEQGLERVALVLLWLPIIAVLWNVLFLPLPRWWGPAWFREGERVPRVDDAFSAGVVAVTQLPRVSSKKGLYPTESGEPIAQWRANFIKDPDSKARAHGLAVRGGVTGTLAVFDDQLVFWASRIEDTIRQEPLTLKLPVDSITRVYVVPPRAGADGIPRTGFMYRSAFPRLAVRTDDSAFVFEVTRAGKVAAVLRQALQVR